MSFIYIHLTSVSAAVPQLPGPPSQDFHVKPSTSHKATVDGQFPPNRKKKIIITGLIHKLLTDISVLEGHYPKIMLRTKNIPSCTQGKFSFNICIFCKYMTKHDT